MSHDHTTTCTLLLFGSVPDQDALERLTTTVLVNEGSMERPFPSTTTLSAGATLPNRVVFTLMPGGVMPSALSDALADLGLSFVWFSHGADGHRPFCDVHAAHGERFQETMGDDYALHPTKAEMDDPERLAVLRTRSALMLTIRRTKLAYAPSAHARLRQAAAAQPHLSL